MNEDLRLQEIKEKKEKTIKNRERKLFPYSFFVFFFALIRKLLKNSCQIFTYLGINKHIGINKI